MWQDLCFKLKLLFTCHNGVAGNSKDQDPRRGSFTGNMNSCSKSTIFLQ